MRILFLDCFSGISGDMTVGALCDLGVNPSTFEWELSKLDIGDFHMHFDRQQRQGITGIKFGIHEGSTHSHECEHSHDHEEHGAHHEGHTHSHSHGDHCCHGHSHGEHDHHHEGQGHSHGEHTHSHGAHHHHDEHTHCHGDHHHHGEHDHDHEHGRSYAEIRALVEKSDLSPFVKKHTLSIFHRIAVAEGRIHGQPPESVTFHEVGALDSIADIICACVGIEALKIEAVHVSPIFDGRGWVTCAHGKYPVPAMATLEILKGIPLGQIDEPYEFITPTGAAILAEFGASFGTMPAMRIEKLGYGIGTRIHPSRPNVLRAIVGEVEAAEKSGRYERDTVVRLETNLDDLSPELTAATLNTLLAAGALDVFLTPVQMKKGRPGTQLTLLCEEGALAPLADLLFRETTAFGVRIDRLERWKLARRFETVATPHGEVTIKIGSRSKDGEDEIVQIAPEFESCRAVSQKSGQPLRSVYEAALAAYHAR